LFLKSTKLRQFGEYLSRIGDKRLPEAQIEWRSKSFGQEIVGEEGTPCNAVRDWKRHQVNSKIAKKAIRGNSVKELAYH